VRRGGPVQLRQAGLDRRRGHVIGLDDDRQRGGLLREGLLDPVERLHHRLDGDKIAKGVDKAADAIDKQTKGKYADKIAKGRTAAKDGLDKLDGKNDDIR
jgi:hypothetical protein